MTSKELNETIRNNKGLLYKQLAKFGLLRDQDAESLGYEALYNAIDTFDSTKRIKLSTYATVCIYNALGSYLRTKLKKRQLEIISYNAVAYAEDGRNHEYVELMPSKINIEQDYVRKDLCQRTLQEVKRQYSLISNAKQKAIIKVWIDSEYEASTIEIAKQVGISQPYTSQVLSCFKYKVRKKMEE
jgi:RNA polymerase sporulation-specific sigma factor